MKVFTKNRIEITLADDPFSEGGEGKIFKVTSGLPQYDNTCVKIYFDKYRTPKKASKIQYMVQNPPAHIKGKGFLIGWPLTVIVDSSGAFLGFMMYLAPKGSQQLVNLTATKVSKKLNSEWHQYYDRENGKFSLISRLKLVHNIAVPVHLLHSTGKYVLTDFKPQNVLVTRNGIITLVDMDSIQIMEGNRLLQSFEVLTPDYIPPEYYTNDVGKDPSRALSKSWDNFQIGVVFYQLLFGLHPYMVTPKFIKDDSSMELVDSIAKNLFPFGPNRNAIDMSSSPPLHNKFTVLPLEIQTLFRRAFSSNPNERPNAEEWGKIIHQVIKDVPPPPPPIVQHKVRFLSPDGRVLKELWIKHGQRLSSNHIPQLPISNGKTCPSWNGNPAHDIIIADRDYQAEQPTPPIDNNDDEQGKFDWSIILVIVLGLVGLVCLLIFSEWFRNRFPIVFLIMGGVWLLNEIFDWF